MTAPKRLVRYQITCDCYLCQSQASMEFTEENTKRYTETDIMRSIANSHNWLESTDGKMYCSPECFGRAILADLESSLGRLDRNARKKTMSFIIETLLFSVHEMLAKKDDS